MVALAPAPGWEASALLDLAGSVERGSEHPLGSAIVVRAREDELGFRPVSEFLALAGSGVEGRVDGRVVIVGSSRLMAERGVATDDLETTARQAAAEGRTAVWVAVDGTIAGLIAIADPVKPEARAGVRRLTELGLEVWLVTGDARATAEAVAGQVGIPPDRVLSDVLPEAKAAAV